MFWSRLYWSDGIAVERHRNVPGIFVGVWSRDFMAGVCWTLTRCSGDDSLPSMHCSSRSVHLDASDKHPSTLTLTWSIRLIEPPARCSTVTLSGLNTHTVLWKILHYRTTWWQLLTLDPCTVHRGVSLATCTAQGWSLTGANLPINGLTFDPCHCETNVWI